MIIPMIDELTGSDRIAERMEDLDTKMRRSFEALMVEIHFTYHYHPTKMTTPGQVETDRDRQSEYYMYQGQGG